MKMRNCLLGDIITFQRGYDLPKTQMKPGKIPVVGSNGIIGYHDTATTEAPCITIGRSGNVGTPKILFERAWAHNTTLYIKEFKNTDPIFVFYLLTTLKLNEYAGGSAVPTLNRNHIHSLAITIPDELVTQKKVGQCLRLLDSKIEQNAQINRNLEQQAQAIFKSWFVDFEPFQDGRFVDSELGPIPDGWRVVEMGDVTTEKRAKVGKQILKVFSAVNTGELKLSEDYFTKQVFSKDIGKYIVVEPLSFAYNPARINIGSIGINDMGYAGCVSPVYVVFSAENGYHHFINFLIKRPFFKEELKTRSSGSVRQSLGYKDFGLIKTIYPPHSIIEQFNKVYEPILDGIKHNLAENTKLITLRDTLLPKLMSGEIDVSEVEV